MKRNIILLDGNFPFGDKESFLETEVKYYNEFDSIFICPCSEKNFSNQRHIENDKVIIIKLNDRYGLNKVIKLFRYFLAIFNKDVIAEIIMLINNKRMNLSNFIQLISFTSVANEKYKEIKKEFSKMKIDKDDSIVFYSYWMHFHAYIAIKLKKLYPNSIAISRCHGFDLYEYRNQNNYIPLRTYILRNLDTIFSISDDGKKYLEDKYKNLEKNIMVSRLGTIGQGIRGVNLNRKPLKIVSCSWLLPIKRVDKIINSLSKIKNIEIEWTHLGGGILFDEVKEKSEKNLTDNISFNILGALTNQEIQDFYKKNDYHVFLNVSETEGVPVSIMEAISYGMPVIATNVGGVKEIVKDGFNGFLLDKNFKDEGLIKNIRNIYEMPEEEYLKLRENSRKMWEQYFNAEINYENFIDELYFHREQE